MQLRSKVSPRSQAVKILIADDDLVTRHLLKKTLERAGYEVIAVESGRLALGHLAVANGPRLVLVDWQLPELDGITICGEIRRHSELPYVYVILLTSDNIKADISRGLEAGADDYLAKPCEPEELKARLRAGERILELEDKLTHDALHDPLTQLPNRAFFLERLALCVNWGMQHSDYQFAVLSVDMDRFSILNDSLGNVAGDRLLVQIADRLLGSIRRDDAILRSAESGGMTGHPQEVGVLARLGGDKFTILLDHIRNASEGIRVAERIQQNIQEPFYVDGQAVFTTASIGIAFSGSGYSAAEDMLGDANTAMARAKTLGNARYEMCDPSMHATAAGRWRLETDLRRALAEEFRVHYQPIVSLSDSRIIGFEALVRWQRPKVGLVMPAGFISVAEDTGLILRIGKWVLAEACRQMHAWNLQFSSGTAFTMAVNISARQFAETDLVSQIENILSDSGLAPRYLRLELTESVTMCDEERTARILSELRSKGVRVSIDDFGIGYSSLSYLRRFGPDVLKIDRSFISEMLTNSESREIVKVVLGLGNNLAMDIVAEGVETAEQANMLKSLGCKYGQGYFFSKPLDSVAATRCLVTSEAHNYKLPQRSMTQLVSLREASAG